MPTISAASATVARSSTRVERAGVDGESVSPRSRASTSNSRRGRCRSSRTAARSAARRAATHRRRRRRRSRSSRRGRPRARTSSPARRSAPLAVGAGERDGAGHARREHGVEEVVSRSRRAAARTSDGREERPGRGDVPGLLAEQAEVDASDRRRARRTRAGAPRAASASRRVVDVRARRATAGTRCEQRARACRAGAAVPR